MEVRTLVQYQALRDSSEMNVFCSLLRNMFEPFFIIEEAVTGIIY